MPRTGNYPPLTDGYAARSHLSLLQALVDSMQSDGSKYWTAGTGFGMLPVAAKKSVTCCSHFVTVPSAKSLRHSATGNTFWAANCCLKSANGTCGYCCFCRTWSASSLLLVRYSLPSAQALINCSRAARFLAWKSAVVAQPDMMAASG